MPAPIGHRSWSTPIIFALIGTSWIALWAWGSSPYGRYLHQGSWPEVGFLTTMCSGVPAGGLIATALLNAGSWLLMSSAMMLPSTLPLLRMFDHVTSERTDHTGLIALLIGGYLFAWTGFGLVAQLVDTALHVAARSSEWLTFNAWVVGVTVLTGAGVFQFSPLKYRCLERCRSPFSFVVEHWHGLAPKRDAFRLGVYHGLWCLGCCWALMLIMVFVGSGNIAWMLVLGAVMATEKNFRWADRMPTLLGAVLLVWAAFIIAINL